MDCQEVRAWRRRDPSVQSATGQSTIVRGCQEQFWVAGAGRAKARRRAPSGAFQACQVDQCRACLHRQTAPSRRYLLEEAFLAEQVPKLAGSVVLPQLVEIWRLRHRQHYCPSFLVAAEDSNLVRINIVEQDRAVRGDNDLT